MSEENKYVRFDWAAKGMLRDRSTFGRSYPEGLEKASFAVLEGLVTVLLGEPIRIEEILESESNQNARWPRHRLRSGWPT